jgi:hypothetical protein
LQWAAAPTTLGSLVTELTDRLPEDADVARVATAMVNAIRGTTTDILLCALCWLMASTIKQMADDREDAQEGVSMANRALRETVDTLFAH